jgi:hypothetical protein
MEGDIAQNMGVVAVLLEPNKGVEEEDPHVNLEVEVVDLDAGLVVGPEIHEVLGLGVVALVACLLVELEIREVLGRGVVALVACLVEEEEGETYDYLEVGVVDLVCSPLMNDWEVVALNAQQLGGLCSRLNLKTLKIEEVDGGAVSPRLKSKKRIPVSVQACVEVHRLPHSFFLFPPSACSSAQSLQWLMDGRSLLQNAKLLHLHLLC